VNYKQLEGVYTYISLKEVFSILRLTYGSGTSTTYGVCTDLGIVTIRLPALTKFADFMNVDALF
jgi:hypothetical protein